MPLCVHVQIRLLRLTTVEVVRVPLAPWVRIYELAQLLLHISLHNLLLGHIRKHRRIEAAVLLNQWRVILAG